MVKLYVLPVESACNAKCPYCVNQFRNLGNSFLSVDGLEKCLNEIGNLDAIEISGGGEPTLHPQIEKIIDFCADKARTQMYSNGKIVNLLLDDTLQKLNPLCISRAYYDSKINQQIMGIEYNDEFFSRGLNIKLSAVLLRGGVESPEDVKKYISWAKGKANKVVFRPLFEDVNYSAEIKDKIVSLDSFADYFGFSIQQGKNIQMVLDGIDVEFEVRSCSCENTNPILHADGKLNYTWDSDDINWK
jgi:molybdenum cofactor biosynthesis enzyme MoaA